MKLFLKDNDLIVECGKEKESLSDISKILQKEIELDPKSLRQVRENLLKLADLFDWTY